MVSHPESASRVPPSASADPQVAFRATVEGERLVAIVRGQDESAALATVLTLIEAGVQLVEVSLTTAGALAVIRKASAELAQGSPGIGAGTVRTATDAAAAQEAGATFAVSPGLGPGVDACLEMGLPVLAGAYTPTEAMAAAAAGVAAVKLFPAFAAGGPAYLKALRDPLPDIPFVPVGGVDTEMARTYLAGGALAVGVGSPLIGDAVTGGDLAALRSRAAAFLTAVAQPT